MADLTGRCATCRWAEASGPFPDSAYPLMCKRVSIVESWVEGDAYQPPDGALAATDENDGGYARLLVSPDFGCVQYEAKETLATPTFPEGNT